MSSFQVPPTKIGEEEKDEILHRLRGPLSGTDTDVIRALRNRFLDPPSSLPYKWSEDEEHKRLKHGYSWEYIAHYTEQLFGKQRDGFFVEAGALDGEYLSNSLWLEEERGWTGLLIEPDKGNYLDMLTKHRKAWTSNSCLSDTLFPKEFVQVGIRLNREYAGHKWDYRGSSYLLGKKLNARVYDHFFEVADKSYSVVQCFPLESYLLALNVSTVDFLSLDIQGAEKEVLRNFPWHAFKVRVIVVEIIEDEKDYDFVSFMESKGYVMVNKKEFTDVEDQIYAKNDEKALKNIVLYTRRNINNIKGI